MLYEKHVLCYSQGNMDQPIPDLYRFTSSTRKAVELAPHYFCLRRRKPLSQPHKRGGDSMRGKLRDKRITTKREGTERQRPGKRDNRSTFRLSLQLEDDELEFDLEEEAEEEEAEAKI